ncbi:unnamed protein product [Calypogeia fissa]
MQAAIRQTGSSLHSQLTGRNPVAAHSKDSPFSLKWRSSGSVLCQSSVHGPQFSSTSLNHKLLNLSRPLAFPRCRGKKRLPSSGFCWIIPSLVKTRVGAIAGEENVEEEQQQQGINSSDNQQNGFVELVEILKVAKEDKFRYHTVPKLKLMLKLELKLDPALVLCVLKHREIKPSVKWKFFVWAKKQMGYKHTTEIYNIMIVILLENGKFTHIFYLLEDMYKAGVSLTPETCVRMAKTFASVGMVERAIHALNHMTRLGSPANTRHLNSVVMELVKGQHHYKAYIAYKEMVKTGCEPDGFTFKLLLRALGREETVDLACLVFDDMQTRGCEPDAETASLAVGSLCQCGRIDEALGFFEKIKQKGIKFNARVYNHLLNGLGETGSVETTADILEEMRSLGYTPERDSIATVVDVLRDSGREEPKSVVCG